ncbi:embryonic abundant protein VF30.1-like [Cicer arietinum]|uniref:Embryonic abundant protein VF30.1-like n=1 Tax=Cicer arietinum TaxID=3827 RepID=A0A1S2XMW9_CICAR|nr:embryonic abundant protein VF30.1-like [Cicer arietinum]
MEFARLSILTLFCLAFVGISASPLSGEDYWQSIWPNTPLPKIFLDLLLPYGRTNSLPIRAEEMNQYSTLFFEHDLYPGKKMTLGNIQSLGKMVRPFIKPTQGVTDSIWLANKERQSLNDFCSSPTATGEHKHCVSSLESMIDHVISHFGTTKIKAISSTFVQNQDQYVVEEVKKVGDNAVMCHRLNFEKVVFNCHQVQSTIAYVVSLVAPDGTKAKALTVCHHDTRGMNPELLYEALKVDPGTIPICHFIGNKAAAWVSNHSNDHLCVI